ncbi:MAG: hypothetical protein ACYCSS_14950 [Sulfuriferula sp.]
MTATANKNASCLGTLIRPNGTRLPITGLLPDGKISVLGVYVEFETTIGAAIASGYSLENASPALSEAWDASAARRKAQPQLAIHSEG